MKLRTGSSRIRRVALEVTRRRVAAAVCVALLTAAVAFAAPATTVASGAPGGVVPAAVSPVPVVSRATAWVVRSSAAEGAVDAEGNRLLAGVDRYATAVLLAEVPLAAGDAGTGDVLVVSGESLVDAVSAVSVAAARRAVVVLTERGELPASVRELLSARGFDRATIGGGVNAVSDSVRGELAGLVGDDGDRSSGSSDDRAGAASSGSDIGASAGGVARVEGATRYETAVEAAEAAVEAGDPGSWCDTGDMAAIVVSGESLVDGVVAAPVAYAWGLPLLFTQRDALPDRVAEYLDEASIERVVVVGSTNDIGAAVTDALEGAGVSVTRIDGRTLAARSVELVEAVEGCATQPVALGEYALLDANQPVDGVAAAAALATGLGEHSDADALIPILAVNQNTLPQVVADYLADAGERYGDITLYPLGGDARLTPQVISRAVAAAEGDDATDDAAADDLTDDAAVDTRDLTERLVAAGLTVGVSDGTGVAVGHNVVVEDGVIKVEPPAGRTVRVVRTQIGSPDADANPIPGEWFVSPGVLDPYLWQPEIPVLEAGVDHDGDGTLSADEKYPLGSPERAAYMVASGGQAPPGATVLAVPDMHTRGGGSPGEGHRSTADRYPTGIPVPPGAPDRATSTFVERQLERKQRFETYSGGRGFGRWASDHDWGDGSEPWTDGVYADICSRTPEARPGSAPMGVPTSVDGITCETAADWYLWMCDTMNSPEVKALGYVGGWLETFDRFYNQWQSQLPEPWLWRQNLEEQTVISPWQFELTSGQPRCTSNDDPANANSPENRAAHAERLRELAVWGSDNTLPFGLGTGNAAGPDSAWWESPGNRLNVRADVTASWRHTEHTRECWRDVRYCAFGDLSQLRSLRALV